MPYRKITRHLDAEDGTRIALHVHLGAHESEAALEGRPTVVLTNGIGTSENFWRYLVDAMTPAFRVVHWDYRGHGDSEESRSGDYSIATQARDLELVTRSLGPNLPVHIAFSMGVTVLLELFRRERRLIPAMALIAGAPDAPGSTEWPLHLPGAMALLRTALRMARPFVPLASPLVKAAIATPLVYPVGRLTGLLRARAPREDIIAFMAHLRRIDARAYWSTLEALFGAHGSDVLPTVDVPTLVVATENDILVPRAQVERMRDGIPGARWLLLRDAGHAGLLEAGSEVAEAVLAFVGEQAAAKRS